MKTTYAITVIAAMALAGAYGTTVKYNDVLGKGTYLYQTLSNSCAKAKIDVNSSVEINSLKFYEYRTLMTYGKTNGIADEVDTFLAANTKLNDNDIQYGLDIAGDTVKADYPKFFARLISIYQSKYPTYVAMFNETEKFAKPVTVSQKIALLGHPAELSFRAIDRYNEDIKIEGLRVVKIYLRKNGKSFVAKKDANGNVISNPLTEPMKELTDALNAARYAGLNEWIVKYNAKWNAFDGSNLITAEALETLKENILIDDDKIEPNSSMLRVCLGVEGFNAFVKEYNEGVN